MNVQEILVTKEARFNLLAGLIRLAKCDENIDNTEVVFYQQAAISFGLEEKFAEKLNDYWNGNDVIKVDFETRREKIFFFIQAIQLCWVDKEYVDKEREEVRKIAEELNIEEKVIESIEEWVFEGIVWNRKSENLLNL